MELTIIVYILSLLTAGVHLVLLAGLALWLSDKILHRKDFIKAYSFVKKRALLFAFIISAVATAGSLFFSEVLLWEPCRLCWFQRIFMYPQSVIFLIANLRKDKKIFRYAVPLSIIGSIISAYHYSTATLFKLSSTGFCSVQGTSCLIEYVKDFNYITIPMMAFTAFITIIILGIITLRKKE